MYLLKRRKNKNKKQKCGRRGFVVFNLQEFCVIKINPLNRFK